MSINFNLNYRNRHRILNSSHRNTGYRRRRNEMDKLARTGYRNKREKKEANLRKKVKTR